MVRVSYRFSLHAPSCFPRIRENRKVRKAVPCTLYTPARRAGFPKLTRAVPCVRETGPPIPSAGEALKETGWLPLRALVRVRDGFREGEDDSVELRRGGLIHRLIQI